MAVEFQPRSYQEAILKHQLGLDRSNVWAGMGTGKTVCVLTAIDFEKNVLGQDTPVLVLAPKRVALMTWRQEVAKWRHLQHLRVNVAIGPESFRHAMINKPHDVLVTNYDTLPWLIEYYSHRWKWRTVVADESTRLKSFRLKQGGHRAQALASIAHSQVDRWVNLTGTPSPNGLRDLWGQNWFVDKGKRLGLSFSAFEDRWFSWQTAKEMNKPRETRVLVPTATAQTDIEGLMRDVTITVRAKDFMDLPPLVTNDIYVELPPLARRHYKELEKDLFTTLSSGENINAANAAVKTMKCLQCANGALYTDENGTWAEVHDAKIDAMRSVVEEAAGAPLLVAHQFKSDADRLLRAFPFARRLDNNPDTVTAWNAGKIPMLLAHPKSAGHGLNLQHGGNIIVFFGLWWSLEEHQQIIERIGPTRQAQSGYDRPVFVHRIVAARTIDEVVIDRLEGKGSVQDLLLASMGRAA